MLLRLRADRIGKSAQWPADAESTNFDNAGSLILIAEPREPSLLPQDRPINLAHKIAVIASAFSQEVPGTKWWCHFAFRLHFMEMLVFFKRVFHTKGGCAPVSGMSLRQAHWADVPPYQVHPVLQ
jgi:hypothetical protein